MPVTMPGSAIGSTSRNETASRPKNLKRATPTAAAEPSTSAAPVATSATRTESHSASRTSCECQATLNQFVVKPGIGQLCTFDLLNAYTMISTSGTQRKRMTSAVQTDERDACAAALHHIASNAPSLRAISR